MGDSHISVFGQVIFKTRGIYVGPDTCSRDGYIIFFTEFCLQSRIDDRSVGAPRGIPGSVISVDIVSPGGNFIDSGANVAYFVKIVKGVDRRKNSAARAGNGALSVNPACPSAVILAVCRGLGLRIKGKSARNKGKGQSSANKKGQYLFLIISGMLV